jgi:hypothetical protein
MWVAGLVVICVLAAVLLIWGLVRISAFITYLRMTREQRWKKRYDDSLKKNYKYW